MYRAITVLAIILTVVTSVYSQEFKSHIGISGGLSMPSFDLSDTENKSLTGKNDYNSCYASLGWSGQIEASILLYKRFGIYAKAFSNGYAQKQEFQKEVEAIFDNDNIPVTVYNVETQKPMLAFGLVTGLAVSNPIGKRISQDAHLAFGFIAANLPKVNIDMRSDVNNSLIIFQQTDNAAVGFALDFGIGGRISITEKFYFKVYLNPIIAFPKFKDVKQDLTLMGEIYPVTFDSSPIWTAFNVNFGLGYQWGK